MKLLEPYRREEGSLDWKAITVLTSLLRAGNPDAFVLAVILIIILVIIAVNVWFAYLVGRYVWNLYTKRVTGNGPSARALQLILIGWVVLWVFSFALYHVGGIGTALHINILGGSFLLFAFGVTQVDRQEERKAKQLSTSSPPPTKRSHIKDFLYSKKNKQP